MNDHLHIVCLDAPAPPDYGGAIDMYYKIVSLAEFGKKIILHYFNYNSTRSISGLDNYCKEIYSYPRKRKSITIKKPYIVTSRVNAQLTKRLSEDSFPVILEGIHCTGTLPALVNNERKIVVRVHNDEAKYYNRLAKAEKNFLKKSYYAIESKLLNQYQFKLSQEAVYACLSQTDEVIFRQKYSLPVVQFLPCFVPWQHIRIKEGKGTFCLYHGKMSVSENEEAAKWLIENVFSSLSVSFIIAGSGISAHLKRFAAPFSNIQLINNPTIVEMDELIRNAQINVLPSLNNTGVKLKLLHALFDGRFCVTNKAGVSGSGLESLVELAESPAETKEMILKFFDQPFTKKNQQQRQLLMQLYDNKRNAELLNEWIS